MYLQIKSTVNGFSVKIMFGNIKNVIEIAEETRVK